MIGFIKLIKKNYSKYDNKEKALLGLIIIDWLIFNISNKLKINHSLISLINKALKLIDKILGFL